MRQAGGEGMVSSEVETIRVLLLSDLPIMAWGIERLLDSRRPAIAHAGTARTHAEAVGMLQAEQPDKNVTLIDLDGENALSGIHELLSGGRTKVLGMTVSRDLELHDRAVLAGASGVVCKREPVEVLFKAIEKVHRGEFWLDRAAIGRIFMNIAHQRAAPDEDQIKIARLTRKERLTVAEVARDASASCRVIAERLNISEHTLRNHLTSIYEKLGVGGRLELHVYAVRHGLNRQA